MNPDNLNQLQDLLKWATSVLVTFGVVGLVANLMLRASRSGLHAHPAPPATPSKPPETSPAQLKTRWDKATERFNAVREQWQAFELDAAAVLWERPQLADVAIPTTAAFHEQLERTKDLHATGNPKDAADVEAFYDAALRLELTWKRADSTARRTGTRHYDAPTRNAIDRARKLLNTAVRSATAAEASAALSAARRILEQINITIPAGAYNRLQAAARQQLTQHSEEFRRSPLA